MKYTHLFFDLDHTLWDFDRASEETWRVLWAEHELDTRIPAGFDAFFPVYCGHNDRMWERFRNGFMKREELRWKRVWHSFLDFKLYDTDLAHRLSTAYLELLPTQRFLMPAAKELLEYCRDKFSMHLITNGFETTQRLKLRHSGIAEYFGEIFTSERCSSIKPQPEIFHFAMATCGADCERSLMIGDALDIDIKGAMGVGMDTAYYNPKALPHSEKPTYELRELGELIAVLGQ
jgi:putative hydrolase of the HAD superfamily